MRILSIAILLTLFISFPAYCQIDTLELVEIGNIQASSEITELYIEDLDGDSLKEIILCTDYFVYIYDSQTYQVEWTSPPLIAPTDLLFEDINGDGLIDLSVKDNTYIHLFDPHTPQTIWISPSLDNTYNRYTIGNGNNDNWVEVAILNRVHTPDSILFDTLKIDIHDGPLYQLTNTMTIPLANFIRIWSSYYEIFFQSVNDMIFATLSEQGNMHNRLLLFTSYSQWLYPSDPYAYDSHRESGNLIYIDALNLQQIFHIQIGVELIHIIEGNPNSQHMYILTGYYYSDWDDYSAYWSNTKKVFEINADTVISNSVLWSQENNDWGGYISGEINPSFLGEEISFISNDSIYLHDFSTVEYIWSFEDLDDIDTLLFIFRSTNLFNSPQIVGKTIDQTPAYEFFSGSDGSLSAILPDYGYELSQVTDLNNDSNDEILSIQGSGLYIYDLDYATGVGDNTRLPQSAFLRTNFPNPFNSSTTIEYGLPEAEHVIVKIYDLLGRKVETLVDKEKQAGRHQVVWEADRYASGLYFYRIETGNYSDTKRMVYLK